MIPDLKTILEIGGLLISLTLTFAGMQWRLAAVEKSCSERAADLERSVAAIGGKLDDARNRITVAERDIEHQDGALARIEAAITTATARLEIQIGSLQSQIVEALRTRKE